jgi:xanthine dehydrogenase large subunit
MSKLQPHDSAREHVSGEAVYIDDRPLHKNEVFVDVFYSPIAKGKIKKLDFSKCLELPGVEAIFTYKDLKHNLWGSIFHDQPWLAESKVEYVGEPIAVIAANDKNIFHEAKRAIICEIAAEDATLDIQTAIDKKEFIGPERTISRGQVVRALEESEHKLQGVTEIAGQDHFYLESQASIAYPREGGQIEVHSSSQHPTEVQHCVAEALGLKFHQVVCTVKRMGGAFGGKESQAAPFAVFAALVAQKLQRPARCVITKDDDMIMTGKRNPFKNFYEVGFNSDGKITALKAQLYSDGGAYADLSTAIMERAMLHLDNAYYIENFSVTGQVCKTNTPPNTAFRGFGGPKGVATIEGIIEDIATQLGKDSMDVRMVNVYQKGQDTPYGQLIDDEVLPELFERVNQTSSYGEWRKKVDRHNKQKNLDYRGLAVTAVKFGISFTTRFLNQGSALVNLHMDGTVQVSTGATEMGQGVNIKIAQVVAEAFGIEVSDVKIMSTSTEKNPNTSATAASSGSDINGAAALNACNVIKENLAKVARAVFDRPRAQRGRPVAGAGTAPEINIDEVNGWEGIEFEKGSVTDGKNFIPLKELIEEAYLNRVPLTHQGFFRYPEIHFDKETGKGRPFFYYTNGVAATEVSVDRFTGELKVMRTDIYMDLGRPINQGIDLGQVTGAFVQGMGWVTTENLFYDKGLLVSHSPSTYKIPSVHDIPREFNVELIENNQNIRNLRGSKAVGEPPLLLAVSVWAAVKNALSYARGKHITPLKIPATQEHIYMTMREGVR